MADPADRHHKGHSDAYDFHVGKDPWIFVGTIHDGIHVYDIWYVPIEKGEGGSEEGGHYVAVCPGAHRFGDKADALAIKLFDELEKS
jgi:hypothetical protein